MVAPRALCYTLEMANRTVRISLAAALVFIAAVEPACQIGPSCDDACNRLAGCVDEGTCLSTCKKSNDESAWRCLAEGTGSACNHSFFSCNLSAGEQSALGIDNGADLRDPNAGPALHLGEATLLWAEAFAEKPLPGGRACADVTIVNQSDSPVEEISAEVTSRDPMVTLENQESFLVSLEAGESLSLPFNYGCDNGRGFAFYVADGAKVGSALDFEVMFTDPYSGQTWSDGFSFTSGKTTAALTLYDFAVADDGNDNGVVNAGEVVCFGVQLFNNGGDTAFAIDTVVTSNSANAVISQSAATTIDQLNTGESSRLDFGYSSCPGYNDLQVTFAPGTGGTSVTFDLGATSSYGGQWSFTHTVSVQP